MRPLPPPRVSGYVRISNDVRGKGGPSGGMVTDGSRLYLAKGSGGGAVIAQIPLQAEKRLFCRFPSGSLKSRIFAKGDPNSWSPGSAMDLDGPFGFFRWRRGRPVAWAM